MILTKTEYKNIGETVFSGTLDNGLRIRIVPKKGFHSYYAAFATDYGGAHRRFELEGERLDTPAGVAHFLEHKMFDLPDGDNALNLLSRNGADPNAFTSSDMTCYYFQCTEKFEDNLRLLLHFVSTPYFTEETVQKEQGIIAQEISMGDDNPDSVIYYSLLEMLFRNHPLKDKVAGTAESISHITAQTLYDCHRRFYAPANMVLAVEGDVDPERIAAVAEEMLTSERSPIPRADIGEDDGLLPYETRREKTMEVSAPQFLIGSKFRAEEKGEGALRQRLISLLALRMLLGRSSPFYARLYAEGLINRSFDYESDFTAGTAMVILGGESRDPERVLAELSLEVQKTAKEGFDNDLFLQCKKAGIGAKLRGLEDFESVCLALVEGAFDGYDALSGMELLDSLTKEDCERFVIDALSPERLAMSLILPERK